jgi:hypothetical protein
LQVALSAGTLALTASSYVAAGPIWFDPSAGSRGYKGFADLEAAYESFVTPGLERIEFGLLADGVKLDEQYSSDYGVSFLNSGGGRYDAYSGVRPEGGSFVENLTGYDGSYMPDGSKVYLKFDNNVSATPFTILFNTPVSEVGSFLAVGKEGTVHSLTITVYDVAGRIVGQNVIDSWLWDCTTAKQNYETFFALRTDSASIARVEIVNNSTTDYSNALVMGNLSFLRTVPEPASLAFMAVGWFTLCRRRVRVM